MDRNDGLDVSTAVHLRSFIRSMGKTAVVVTFSLVTHGSFLLGKRVNWI